MTFDLAQMIADREAGTPGPFRAEPLHNFRQSVSADDWSLFASVVVGIGGEDEPDQEGMANLARFIRLPAVEAEVIRQQDEIIRLTARVDRLEGALSEFRSAAMWTKHAAEVLDGYEADYGEFLPLIYEIGRIPDSSKTASFRIYPNHIRGLADLLKPRAALSTHTEEPKT